MSLVSVYDALKAESAPEQGHIERRLIRLEISVAVIIALQIGQILLILRILTG